MITAARFGSAPVLLDWSGLKTSSTSSSEHTEQLTTAWQKTLQKLNSEVSGFYNAVVKPELSQIQPSIALAKKFQQNSKIKDCLFIGIGGSSLGPMCLIDSLKHRATSPIQFHFFENPDPIDWNYRIKKLNPESTLVCVVTKSGTTYETLSLFMLAFSWLKNTLGVEGASAQTVAITDPEKGELLEFAKKHSISTLMISPAIGGRFSIFSPVGLFAGALAGFDMEAFILGGKKIRDYCEKATPEKNLFATWAGAMLTLEKTHPIHVMMPYSTSLRLVSNWWVQIWAESLGKGGRGFTPLPCLGAIDQHSMLQLLRDGPNDKVIWFLNIQDFGTQAKVPSIDFRVKTFDLLEGQELGSVLDTEFRAVQRVMTNQQRPHLQVQIDSLTEESFGALLYIYCMLTAYMGDVMNLNPFDQPGVEEAKIYIRESLISKKESAKKQADQASDESETHRLRLHRE